jgi:CRP-like cAMP-binding protein
MDDLSHTKPVDCSQCLFKAITCQYVRPDEFQRLQDNSKRYRFRKGEVIIRQGEKADTLVFLQFGIAKFSMEDEAGKGLILTITRGPAMIGGANVFNSGLNLYSVYAVEDCDVCFIDYPLLMELAMNNSPFLLKLMEMITGMFKNSILNFIHMAHKQVNGRIAGILIYLAESVYGNPNFTLSLTRKEISEFAGCSTENVIHTLSKFHREGIIELNGKSVRILDSVRLGTISKVG